MVDEAYGCDACKWDLLAHTRVALVLQARAATDYLLIYHCRECGQWYRHDASDRIRPIPEDEARAWLMKISEGL